MPGFHTLSPPEVYHGNTISGHQFVVSFTLNNVQKLLHAMLLQIPPQASLITFKSGINKVNVFGVFFPAA